MADWIRPYKIIRVTKDPSEAGRRVGRDNRWRINPYSSADPEQHEER